MTTLKQKFNYITQCYATIEEKNKMYYQAVKEWLQQKHKEFAKNTPYGTWKSQGIKELLEELK